MALLSYPQLSLFSLIVLGRNLTIKYFARFFFIDVFWAITFRRNFLAQFLARRKCLGFSANKSPKLSHVFFAAKAFTQLLSNFFEICLAIVILCASSIHSYFSFAKMIRARSQKRKAAAIVINSYLNSAANCVFFFDLRWNEIDEWKTSKYLCLCGTH